MTDERKSPGLILRLERERRGLATEEVASQMRLTKSQVEALEADNYDALPGIVFVRGFIRNYAKLLQIDPAELLETIDAPKESITPIEDEGIPFPSGKKRTGFHYAIIFVLAAFLILVFEMYRENHREPALKPVKAPAVKPEAKPAPVSEPLPVSAPLAAAVAQSAPAASAPVALSAPSASITAPIVLSFDAASWVEVRDGSGKMIFSKLSTAGSTQSIYGQAPFSLTIGNAKHVVLSYEGKPVDLSPYIKAEVAHVTLK